MFQDIMKTKGFTQTQLAKKLGVTQALISKWVNGEGVPRTTMLPKIAEALGVSIEEIVNCFK